jgi:ABC-type transport system substrate-binding protein
MGLDPLQYAADRNRLLQKNYNKYRFSNSYAYLGLMKLPLFQDKRVRQAISTP